MTQKEVSGGFFWIQQEHLLRFRNDQIHREPEEHQIDKTASFHSLWDRKEAFHFDRLRKGFSVMNKIYKVIWSKVRCTWVVVSEIARNHGAKGRSVHEGRKGISLLAGALLLGLLTGNGTAWAAAGEKVQYGDVTIGDYPKTEGNLFVYGTSKFYGTLLFNDGEFAYDSQKHGFSFGKAQYNSKLYNYSIAIGDTGEGSDYSIILGRNASGKGTYDVAIGDTAYAEKAMLLPLERVRLPKGHLP